MNEDRLKDLQNELSQILEARIQQLQNTIISAEESTRRILSTEMEIRRYQEREEEYNVAHKNLRKELDAKRAKFLTRKSEHEAIIQSKVQLEAEGKELEEELIREQGLAKDAQQKLDELEETARALRNENAKLKLQVKSLSENIDGMRKLKDEQMLSVMNLTKELEQVATGKE